MWGELGSHQSGAHGCDLDHCGGFNHQDSAITMLQGNWADHLDVMEGQEKVDETMPHDGAQLRLPVLPQHNSPPRGYYGGAKSKMPMGNRC